MSGTKEFCRVERLSTEDANRKTHELLEWIDKNQKHLELKDYLIYWRNAFWDLMYHRRYGPNCQLIRELNRLRNLNVEQAGKIAELELTIRCLRRVHDGKRR